jgi:hypothetical protein
MSYHQSHHHLYDTVTMCCCRLNLLSLLEPIYIDTFQSSDHQVIIIIFIIVIVVLSDGSRKKDAARCTSHYTHDIDGGAY